MRKLVTFLQLFSLLLILITFPSCNYQFGYGNIPQNYSTITVPFVEGDCDGILTSELIKQFSVSGALRYVPCGGSLILKANLIDLQEENIGFRYDRKKDGKLKDYIIPTESRSTASVEVTVIEGSTGKTILGPTIISAYVDYDHQFYSDRHASNVHSLGQLVDIDSARDTIMIPLNRTLAEKVVDYVINSW